MTEKKLDRQEIEDSFKKSLEDLIPIAERLAPYCEKVSDLVGIIELALSNQGQLRLIISTLLPGASGVKK